MSVTQNIYPPGADGGPPSDSLVSTSALGGEFHFLTMKKEITGYEGRYEITDDGRVLSSPRRGKGSAKTGRELKQYDLNGYRKVCLWRNNTPDWRLVHRLVLEAFVGPCPNGMQTRHLDGLRSHNSSSNLAWGTAHENATDRIRHGTQPCGDTSPLAKLTRNQAEHIRSLRGGVGVLRLQELAGEYGVELETVKRIIRGEAWQHLN